MLETWLLMAMQNSQVKKSILQKLKTINYSSVSTNFKVKWKSCTISVWAFFLTLNFLIASEPISPIKFVVNLEQKNQAVQMLSCECKNALDM